jgi:putative transposase
MNIVPQPWLIFLAGFAGWLNRQQQQVNEYLLAEDQVWREKFGKRRILLTDDQRRRLAVKGKVLGRKLLEEVATLVTPDTILRWHRLLVAKKWDYSQRRRKPLGGRPPIPEEVQAFAVRWPGESWGGYDRIQDVLKNLGHTTLTLAPS